jgi:hypothetical protein
MLRIHFVCDNGQQNLFQNCHSEQLRPKKMWLAENSQPLVISGSRGRTRTADQVVNSHPLYQLSYPGVW